MESLNATRNALGLRALDLKLLKIGEGCPEGCPKGQSECPMEDAVGEELDGVSGGWLEFGNVAVGGTFDRMHAGHRLLLTATALVCTKHVFMGVTGADPSFSPFPIGCFCAIYFSFSSFRSLHVGHRSSSILHIC